MTGELEGGWEFIWSAYIIAWLLLSGYAVYLFTRDHGDVPQDLEDGR
ncbi:MAG: hypothetical protein AAFX94_00045 [Myxococcota bacterium]